MLIKLLKGDNSSKANEIIKNLSKSKKLNYITKLFRSYQRFICGFSKLATNLILILETTRFSNLLVLKMLRADSNKIIEGNDSRRADKIIKICLNLEKKNRNYLGLINILSQL